MVFLIGLKGFRSAFKACFADVFMIDVISRILRGLFGKPFKIGIVSYNYPIERSEIAGSSMHSYNLSRNLAALGCEVHVFCSGLFID